MEGQVYLMDDKKLRSLCYAAINIFLSDCSTSDLLSLEEKYREEDNKIYVAYNTVRYMKEREK